MNCPAQKVKVLVVDDSPTVLQCLTHIFNTSGTLQVVGTACNGREAIDLARAVRPDIITMDIRMPVMDGLEATREIMCTDPVPIVILSASWDPTEIQKSFEAVAAGALASFAKPTAVAGLPSAATRELVSNIEALARIKLVRRRPHATAPMPSLPTIPRLPVSQRLRNPGVVVMGASTGGPLVLQAIFAGLGRDTRLPILVVQHIAKGFTQGLVDWLGASSALPVVLGRHGDLLGPGRVIIAPDDHHMEIGPDEQVVLCADEPELALRPTVSRLFRSAATVYGGSTIAVLLTGMGSDGAHEMRAVKEQGGVTIVQDEESCAVFGMPRAAMQLNAADHVLCPQDITAMLNRLTTEYRA